MDCSKPDIPGFHYHPWFAQTHTHWVSDGFQPSHPLSLPSPRAPQYFPATGSFQMSWVFSNESGLCIKWSKYWSFSFSISPSKGCFPLGLTGLISLQSKTLKNLLQHHSSKVSGLQCSALFMVQLSHPFMNTGKTIDLTIQTFVVKVMSLLFNMLSRLVIAFLPRSKHLLISWLQSSSAVILEPKKTKSVSVSIVSPSFCHEVVGLDAMILVFWKVPEFNSKLVCERQPLIDWCIDFY